MINNNRSVVKSKIYFVLTLLFIYIMLFEFILPVNKVLPKPSLLGETFFSIWTDYNLLQALGLTTTVVYITLILGYLIVVSGAGIFVKTSLELGPSIETLKVFRLFPLLVFMVFFAIWFGNSVIAEFIFVLFTVMFLSAQKVIQESKKVKKEYVLVGRNLGLPSAKIYSKIIWKAVEPQVLNSLTEIHLYVWGTILIYEFAANVAGLGGILRLALLYNDFTAVFAVALMISGLICIGNYLVTFITNHFAVWEQ